MKGFYIMFGVFAVILVVFIVAMVLLQTKEKLCVGRVCCDEQMVSGVTASSDNCHPSDDQLVSVLNGGAVPPLRSAPKNVGALMTIGVEDDYLLARAR